MPSSQRCGVMIYYGGVFELSVDRIGVGTVVESDGVLECSLTDMDLIRLAIL